MTCPKFFKKGSSLTKSTVTGAPAVIRGGSWDRKRGRLANPMGEDGIPPEVRDGRRGSTNGSSGSGSGSGSGAANDGETRGATLGVSMATAVS